MDATTLSKPNSIKDNQYQDYPEALIVMVPLRGQSVKKLASNQLNPLH